MSPLFQTSWDRVGTADIDTDTELAGLLELSLHVRVREDVLESEVLHEGLG